MQVWVYWASLMCRLFFISLGKCYYFCPFLFTIPWHFYVYVCVYMCVWVCVFVYVYKCMYTNMFGGFPKVSENGLFFLTYYSVSQIFCLSHWYIIKFSDFFLLSAQICCLFFIVNFQLLLYVLIQNLSF